MNVLLTGYGSIGSIIAKHLVGLGLVNKLIIADRDEKAVHQAKIDLDNFGNVVVVLADLTQHTDLCRLFAKNPTTIIHTAAVKHVNFCEENPMMAIHNNVIATNKLIDFAQSAEVDRFVYINTDKSVMPTSVMGASKLIAEKQIISRRDDSNIKFNSIRLGNIINSNGSLLPTIANMVANNLPIKITNPEATRYFLSPKELYSFMALILNGIDDVVIIKKAMRSVKLGVMVSAMLEYLGASSHECKIVGLKPGEKLHEHLYTESEAMYVVDRGEYLTIDGQQNKVAAPLCSSESNCISCDEFVKMLKDVLSSNVIYYSKLHGNK